MPASGSCCMRAGMKGSQCLFLTDFHSSVSSFGIYTQVALSLWEHSCHLQTLLILPLGLLPCWSGHMVSQETALSAKYSLKYCNPAQMQKGRQQTCQPVVSPKSPESFPLGGREGICRNCCCNAISPAPSATIFSPSSLSHTRPVKVLVVAVC